MDVIDKEGKRGDVNETLQENDIQLNFLYTSVGQPKMEKKEL